MPGWFERKNLSDDPERVTPMPLNWAHLTERVGTSRSCPSLTDILL